MKARHFITLTISLVIIATGVQAAVVYANGASPGDDFTNAGGTNTGQAVGTSGWYYNNVRNNGHVGVNTSLPRSGNGSASLRTTQGPGGASSKADLEFFATAAANGAGNYGATSAIGTLGSLTGLSYDWYRVSGGTAHSHYHPVIRLQVFDPSSSAFGYLVFERIYNGFGAAPTDQWVSDDVFASDAKMWSTGSLPGAFSDYNTTLGQWQTNHGSYLITGVSLGVGSGWGTFDGAIDNVAFSFGGENPASYDFNFEVNVIPAPAAALLGLIGLGTAAWAKRRSS